MVFNTLATGIRIAGDRGFESEILTGGDWFAHAPEYLEQLSESGPFRLRISLDAEHQRTVSMDTIHALIDTVLARRIPVAFTLRDIPGNRPSPRALQEILLQRHPVLQRVSMESSRLFHVIPTIPVASAGSISNNVSSHSEGCSPGHTAADTAGDPGPCRLGFRDLIIGPDGRVYPCCGLFGLGIDDHIHIGDAIRAFPDTPESLINRRFLFKQLVEQGPLILGRQAGLVLETPQSDNYTNPCHACRMILPELLRDTENGDAR